MGVADKVRPIDAGFEGFETLFGAHAKALLFIDDEKSQVGKEQIFTEQAVGADQDVDFPLRCRFQTLFSSCWLDESR